MTTRVIHTSDLNIAHEAIPAEQVLEGAPTTGYVEFDTLPGLEVGVWEHTPGVAQGVEADEVFVVLAGRVTIEVKGGPTLEVGPSDIVVLRAGESARWTVHETIRKVFIIPNSPAQP